MLFTFILAFWASIASTNGYAMSDITHSILPNNIGHNLNLAAFGDYNSDKLVDIFVLDDGGKSVKLLVAQEMSTSPYVVLELVPSNETSDIITSVVPGDFDGDAQMDILVTRGEVGAVQVEVYWGETETTIGNSTKINTKFQDQPLILDWNGDMIPDLLGETSEVGGKRERVLWYTNGNRTFFTEKFPASEGAETFKVPHSNSFVDIDHDYTADLIITTEHSFEVWINQAGVLKYNHSENFPINSGGYIGQSVWVDIDQDSEPDLLLPVCNDVNCESSVLYVYHKGQWQNVTNMFVNSDGKTFGYVTPKDNPGKKILGLDIPVTLHMGDYDMDGYPDILVLLKNIDKGEISAYLLMNVECNSDACSNIGRTFSVLWSSELKVTGAVQATFFDIYEDGVLDILLVTRVMPAGKPATVTLKAYKNTFSADATFMKITVVSGRCYSDCPKGRTPYGINQPGVALNYETTKPNGAATQGCATQLSQSAHFALQLPYTIFGLGQMPNFVDQMHVGIPRPPGTKQPLSNSWPQIIPNTQLIVIPYKTDTPRYWILKLYVKPSEAIMITGAVLVGCLGVVSAILGGLHWRERKEDKEEKKQEAQKFHFDAM